MSWLSNIFSGTAGTITKEIGNFIDSVHLSKEEKQEFKLKMEALLQQRDAQVEETIRSELQAKERILVAELTQGDSYTKRARPTVVYAGLGFIFINYCLIPLVCSIINVSSPTLKLPLEFWVGWSGIVATWSIGRSAERRGISNKFTKVTTGNSHHSSLFTDNSPVG